MKSNRAVREALAFGKTTSARHRLMNALLFGTALGALCTAPALAQTTYTFTGAGTTSNWSDTANWSGGTVAANSGTDNWVYIQQTGTQTPSVLDTSVTARYVFLQTSSDPSVRSSGYAITASGSNKITLLAGAVTDWSGIEDMTTHTGLNQVNAGITLTGNNYIQLDGTSAGDVFNGVIDGVGHLQTQNAGGQLILAADNTYSGGTLIYSGALQLGNGGTTGSVVGAIAIGYTGGPAAGLVLNHAAGTAFTLANDISGTGSLVKTDSGVTIVTGTNTYGGGTTIDAGTLQLGNGGTTGSVIGDILDKGVLAFDRSDAVTFTYAISGTGSVVKNGTNTLTLTGSNSYSGGTTINAGTLSVSADANLGNSVGAVTINDGATLQLAYGFSSTRAISLSGSTTIDTLSSGSSTYILNGTISGTGSLNKTSGGFLILTADNTYSGGTTVNDGILQLGNGGTTGSIVGNVNLAASAAKLYVSRSSDLTINGVISGNGSLSKLGASTLILTADNTFTGTSTIAGGTLQLGNGGTTGTVGGNIYLAGNATKLVFDYGSGTTTFAHNITGSGSMEKWGGSTLILTGANYVAAGNSDPTAGVYVRGGTLQIGDGTAAASLGGSIFLSNHSQLVVDLPSAVSATITNVTGDGSLGVIGAGKAVLTGTNNYTGGTSISDTSTLQIGNGGAGVSVTGDFTDNSHLIFNVSDTLTIAGVISGSGTVANAGLGTVVLTAANTYGGGTTISGGTLQLGDGHTTGSITGDVVDSGILAFNRSDAYTFAGAISGTGAVAQIGSGVLTLTGTNTYSGGTRISNGTLSVAGNANIGTGVVSLSENAVLQITATGAFTNKISLAGTTKTSGGANGGTIDVAGSATNATWSGVISSADSPATTGGAYTLTKIGDGTLILLGDSTYSGGTIISAGKLQIGGGAGMSTGSITGPVSVAAGAALAFNRTDSGVTFAGVISGNGSVVQAGTGTLILTGTNTYTGGTYVTAGTLSVSSANNLGSGAIALSAGTALKVTATGSFANAVTLNGDPTFNVAPGTTVTWNGLIADSTSPGALPGELELTGGGTLALTANNTYSGGTVVKGNSTLLLVRDGSAGDGIGAASAGLTLGDATTSGILQTGISSVALSRAITLAAGGGVFDVESTATDLLTVSGVIDGSGALTKKGVGTLTLTNANTYSGGTTISAGTLDIGGGGTTGSITGNVVDNATLAFDRSDSTSFAGAISGSGTVRKLGAGTLTFTGNNVYTGGTSIEAGNLSIGNGGTSGSLAGDVSVAAASTLIFNRSDTVTYTGAVSGAGGLTQAGSGTLILTGNSSYAGPTVINGTLQLGNGGSTGSISSASIDDEGVLAINRAGILTIAEAISGAGSLQQIGSGTTILTGTDTYSGGTTVSAGTLQIGNGGTSGSITGNVGVASGGTLAFNRSDTYTFASLISGDGAVLQSGSGTLVLTGNNTYTGTTTVSSGTLQIGNGGTSGAIAGALVDNAAVVFDRSDASAYANVISGSGTITKLGAGTLTLTGNSTAFSGTTTISAGTLQIGNGGTSGSLSGQIVDNGVLAFNRSDTVTYSGAVSGTGSLAQNGSGTTILTGGNSYAGGTTITAGTLQIGNGGTLGAITGNVSDAGILAFNHSDVVTFAGVISGSGGVTQRGIGTVVLTGINTYTGATNVTSGTLLVNGKIVSATTVASGGMIGGTGTTGAVAVLNGGILSPGVNGVGTLSVAGNLTLGTTSGYAVDVTSAAADLTNVTGIAQLGGVLTVTGSGSSFSTTPTAIIYASTINGQFADVVSSGIGSKIAIVSYDATHAYLTISASLNSLLPTSTANTNQAHVAGAVDFAMEHDGAAGFAPLSTLSTDALNSILSQMSGETAGAVRSSEIAAVDTFVETLLNPAIGGREGVSGGTALRSAGRGHAGTVSLWGDFHGGRQELNGAAANGSHHMAGTDIGTVIGLDYSPASGRGAVGVAFGFDQQNFKLSNQLGTGHVTSYHLGAYYSREFGHNYLALAFDYANYRTATLRNMTYGSVPNRYHANFSATDLGSRAEFGHAFEIGDNTLTPFVAVTVQDIGSPDYAETTVSGDPNFALSFTSKQFFDYRTELGTNWDRVLVSNAESSFGLHSRLGWVRNYARLIADTATFSAYNGSNFDVHSASPAKDAAHLNLDIEYLTGGLSVNFGIDGRYASNANALGGSLSAAYHW